MTSSLASLLLYGLAAVGAGGLGALVGLGGGFLLMPILLATTSLTPAQSVSVSLFAVMSTAVGSSIAHARQRRIDHLAGLVLGLGSIPGAMIGARIPYLFTPARFHLVFALVLVGMGLVLVRGGVRGAKATPSLAPGRFLVMRHLVEAGDRHHDYALDLRVVFIGGVAAGIFSGAFGVGGGAIIVPLLSIGLGMPMHVVTATSMFSMIFTALAGIATHAFIADFPLGVAIALSCGALVGAQGAAAVSRQLSPGRLTRVVGGVILLVAATMFYRALYA